MRQINVSRERKGVSDARPYNVDLRQVGSCYRQKTENLPPSEAFPYLGRTITYNNSDWEAVYLNLCKARRRWVMIARVLERKGSTVRAQGEMYKAVDQLVILHGSESWVVNR